MKHLLLFLGLYTIGFGSFAQNNKSKTLDLDLAKQFILTLANEDVPTDAVLHQYVLTDKTDSEITDYLLASLDEIRLNLMSKKVNEIQYLKYSDLPRKEVSDIDPEGKDTQKMYFLKYRNRQLVALYIDQNKIASFTLVSKGNNKAHFVTY